MSSAEINERTLHHPRLLCLHGGGVTAEIYSFQMRSVLRDLAPRFRLVFVDAPFFCEAGPGIYPVYEGMGPYRRWLRWLPSHPELDSETAVGEIGYSLRTAMAADDARGADGPWVGLVGFSQGAKVAASILYDQQVRRDAAGTAAGANGGGGDDDADPQYKFAVIMAGRAPLVAMSPATEALGTLPKAGELVENWDLEGNRLERRLRTPTVHLHGLADPGVALHKKMPELFCEPSSTTVLEWDGDHRVPFKSSDVKMLVDAINQVADSVGVGRPES